MHPWGEWGGQGSSTYSRGPEGLSAKISKGIHLYLLHSPKGTSGCSHAISYSPTITGLTGPLSITPAIEATRFSLALASQFVQRLSLGFRLRSLASLFPKALYFPVPCFPRPLTTHIEFKGWGQSNSKQPSSRWKLLAWGQSQPSTPPKPEDCVSFKRQIINRAKPQENT